MVVPESRFLLVATKPGKQHQQSFVTLEAALRIAKPLALQGYLCCIKGITEADDVGEIYVRAEHAA